MPIPSFGTHRRTVVDFAVTSGLRMGYSYVSSVDGSLATHTYEIRKHSFLDTDDHCRAEGIRSLPFNVEAAAGSFGKFECFICYRQRGWKADW